MTTKGPLNLPFDPWEAAAAEADLIERSWSEYAEGVKKEQDAWRAKWPCHCEACGGWCGHAFGGDYHNPPDFDPCEALAPEWCHRCGYEGFDEDHEGLLVVPDNRKYYRLTKRVCFWCHHNDDDGIPEM